MTTPLMQSLEKIFPIIIEKYERFIPNIEGMDTSTKINEIIQYLNRIGKISNDVVNNWNTVMKWVLDEGLQETANVKIDELIANGTFETLLNEMFTAINDDVTAFKNDVNTQITGFNSSLVDLSTNVKSLGIKGDGTNETVALQNIINNLTDNSTLFFPKGTYLVDQLNFTNKNHITIVGNGAVLKGNSTTADGIININECSYITIKDLQFVYQNSPSVYTSGKANCIKLYNYGYVKIERCVFSQMSTVGIYADQSKDVTGVNGGTTSIPLEIHHCDFAVNTVLTGYEDNTTAIFLGANGEYTLVKDNNFMGTYSAIRGIGGANTIFEDNTIMSSPATFSGLRALVYFQAVPTTAGLNSGKVIIKGNRINHNAGGITAVYCSGDRNRNERRYTIDGNHILVHGDGAQSRCIYLFNADGSIVTNNYLIPTVTTLSAGTSGVIISDCVDVLIDNNTVQYGNGVVLQTGSKAVVGRTIMLNPVTNAVKNYVLDTSLLFTYSGIYNFRFNSAGTMSQSEVDVLSWTSVKNGTGDFTITHNLNTTNYVVTPIADNTSTPSLFTITRTANNFNIKCFNTSGVLTDPASGVMGMVKVSIRELTNI